MSIKRFFSISSQTNRIIAVVLANIVVLYLTACGDKVAEQEELVRPAKLYTVAAGGFSAIRSFPAEVVASDLAVQSFRVGGEIIELPARAGENVKKGDLLARLDPADFELVFNDAKARYDLAKVQFERMADIWEKRLIARADYDKARASYLAADAALNQAKFNLDYTVMRTPFDGIISKVLVDNRANVQAKQPILHVQSVDSIDVVFQVPESVLAQVQRRSGKKAAFTVKFDQHPDSDYDAELKEFNAEANPQTQTFRAVATMKRPKDIIILEGMSASVTVDFTSVARTQDEKLVLPVASVFAADDEPAETGQRYVWKVDPETMRVSRQPIRVGKLVVDGIEVESGLNPGDKVVAAGVSFIREGQLVKELVREGGL